MEIDKERHVIGRINENSEHRDQRLAVRRYKDNLTSKTIIEEHQKAVKNASPVVSQVVSRTRGALKRKALNELFHPSKKLKEVITLYFLHYYYRIGRIQEVDEKNSKATYGMTPFHFAAQNGQVSVCQNQESKSHLWYDSATYT